MAKISTTIFNQKYDLEIEYERNENGNVLKSQLEILEMFISYVLYDYLNTSNLLALRDPNYKKPLSEMDKLKNKMEEKGYQNFTPLKAFIHLPNDKNVVDLVFTDGFNLIKAVFINNRFEDIV